MGSIFSSNPQKSASSNLTTDSSALGSLGTTAILAATVCRGAEDSHAHGAQKKLKQKCSSCYEQ